MSFKTAETAYQKAESKFEDELLKEVERLARAVIESHPKAKSFVMGMGHAFFGCEWTEVDDNDPTDTWERDDNLDPEDLADGNSFAEDLVQLLDKYNRKFCLTGCPMKITRDAITGELVNSADW